MDNKADILIFPILFNANHAIELYLKSITWTLNILLNKDTKIEGQHDINQIFKVVCSKVHEFEKDKERENEFNKLTINLKEYLDELFNKIKDKSSRRPQNNIDFSRYPFTQKYVNHFYIDEIDNVVIDLENFIERFKEIGENLNCIADYYLYDVLEASLENNME
jgi:hypothetical protein